METGAIKNKQVREREYSKLKAEKKKLRAAKRRRQQEAEREGGSLGEASRKKPRTLENTRDAGGTRFATTHRALEERAKHGRRAVERLERLAELEPTRTKGEA